MYNNYIEPRGLIHDADFLTHDFMPTMLDALGLQDTSGVIFEVVEHDYFNITDLGMWDQMMPGMINVSSFRHLEAKPAAFASRILGRLHLPSVPLTEFRSEKLEITKDRADSVFFCYESTSPIGM